MKLCKESPADFFTTSDEDVRVLNWGYLGYAELAHCQPGFRCVHSFSNTPETARQIHGLPTRGDIATFGDEEFLPEITLSVDDIGQTLLPTEMAADDIEHRQAIIRKIYTELRCGQKALITVDTVGIIGMRLNYGILLAFQPPRRYSTADFKNDKLSLERRVNKIEKAVALTPALRQYKLGADPELILYHDTAATRSRQTQISARDVTRGPGMVGADGCPTTFELRPDPSNSAEEMADNIELCLKVLANKTAHSMISIGKISGRFFLESGGGAYGHVGGHVHFGGPLFQKHRAVGEVVCRMMDNFAYHPIRDRMYGGMRLWSSGVDLPKSQNGRFNCADKTIENYFKDVGMDSRYRNSSYDDQGQARSQPHGFEYRSLPSFIVDKTLTRLVFATARGIVEWVLRSIETNEDILYSAPPKKTDYLNIISEEDFHLFQRYINGDKRAVFLRDTFAQWGINIWDYAKVAFDGDDNVDLMKGCVMVNELVKESRNLSDCKTPPAKLSLSSAAPRPMAVVVAKKGCKVLCGKLEQNEYINNAALKRFISGLDHRGVVLVSPSNIEKETAEAFAEFFELEGNADAAKSLRDKCGEKNFETSMPFASPLLDGADDVSGHLQDSYYERDDACNCAICIGQRRFDDERRRGARS